MRHRTGTRLVVLLPWIFLAGLGWTSARAEEGASAEEYERGLEAWYDGGFRVESGDGNFAARIRGRVQFRLTDLSSADLFGEEDGVEQESGFLIRRARVKIDGHAYRPWLQYKFEYGIAAGFLLTLFFDVEQSEELILRIGQSKILYNRERVDSSGKQQFVDRSIVNTPFTVDRQSGLTLHGRLFGGTRADSSYALGWFTGTGRGGALDTDRRGMYLARWQWNFLGRLLPFSQSDIKRYDPGRGSLAFAYASNLSQYTAFSSAGGGQLPGFSQDSVPEQYELNQWVGEFAFQGRGLSLQSEYHFKRIDDRVNLQITELEGWYGQVGYFFSELFDGFPDPLEIAFRAAAVDTIEGVAEIPADRELTCGLNWFFVGHDNKLSFDLARLKSTIGTGSEDSGWRVRFQWDISF